MSDQHPPPTRQQIQTEDVQFQVMRLLAQNPEMSQRDLAAALGLSLGGTHYALKALVERGWLKVQNFQRSNNKLGYAYLLTPLGAAEKAVIAGRFLQRKLAEYEALKQEIAEVAREVASAAHLDQPAESAETHLSNR